MIMVIEKLKMRNNTELIGKSPSLEKNGLFCPFYTDCIIIGGPTKYWEGVDG